MIQRFKLSFYRVIINPMSKSTMSHSTVSHFGNLSIKIIGIFTVLALLLSTIPAFAQNGNDEYEIEPFKSSDEFYMSQQLDIVNDIAGLNLGRKLQGDFSDISLLQDIIDREFIDDEDVRSLQALGAALGYLLEKELSLSWRVYRDKLGRSRALCRGNQTPCLFPTTMLSRRMEVGLKPDVQAVYDKAVDIIRPPRPENY